MLPAAAPTQRLPAILLTALFLFPLEGRGQGDNPGWRRAGLWLVVWGLLIGITYAIVFRISWRWFGEYQYIRFVPVACVLAVDLAWGGYRLIASAAGLAAGVESDRMNEVALTLPALVVIILITLLKYAMLLSLPMGVPLDPSEWGGWRNRLGYLYPQPIYRPLILMPLWGRWAVMLALSIGRVAPAVSPRLQSMAAHIKLSLIIAGWVLCTGLTVFYVSAAPPNLGHGIVMSLGIMVVAYLASFTFGWWRGGQTEATAGATGLAAELAFLALYLPITSHIFWY